MNTNTNNLLKDILDSCHINFLIGSGCSSPYLSTLGNIESLLEEISIDGELQSNTKLKNIIEASVKKYYFEQSIYKNVAILQNSAAAATERASYKIFVDTINNLIKFRKESIIGRQVNLFTTNMDIFLELAIEDSKIDYNDGFKGRIHPVFGTENFGTNISRRSPHFGYKSDVPIFNLYKLHGSVNWRIEPTERTERYVYDTNLSTLEQIKGELGDTSHFIDVTKLDTSSKDNKLVLCTLKELKERAHKMDSQIQTEPVSKFLDSYKLLPIINPTKGKFETTTRNFTFYELLRVYSNILEKANSVLFVMGFSFADEHIREITKRVLVTNPTLQLIIFSYTSIEKKNFEEYFNDYHNVHIITPKQAEDGNDMYKNSLSNIITQYFEPIIREIMIDNKE